MNRVDRILHILNLKQILDKWAFVVIFITPDHLKPQYLIVQYLFMKIILKKKIW